MTFLILILVYISSIFICRYSYRMQYVWGHWDKEDCSLSLVWFIPVFNILVALVNLGYTVKERTYKNKLLNWFTNQDL